MTTQLVLIGILALGVCSGACLDEPKAGAKDLNEYFTGRAVKLHDAVAKADLIFIGQIGSAGPRSPGAPGQAYFEGATVKAERIIRQATDPEVTGPEVVAGESLTVSYTVQSMPVGTAEKVPPTGRPLIFAVKRQKGSAAAAIKIIDASAECIGEVEKVAKER